MPKVIGMVARLSSEKSQGLLVHAFTHVLREHPTASLHLIGSGFLRPYLEELAWHLLGDASSRVKFLGTLVGSDLVHALEDLDVLVRFMIALHSFVIFRSTLPA